MTYLSNKLEKTYNKLLANNNKRLCASSSISFEPIRYNTMKNVKLAFTI